jgi:hypothetical protein
MVNEANGVEKGSQRVRLSTPARGLGRPRRPFVIAIADDFSARIGARHAGEQIYRAFATLRGHPYPR